MTFFWDQLASYDLKPWPEIWRLFVFHYWNLESSLETRSPVCFQEINTWEPPNIFYVLLMVTRKTISSHGVIFIFASVAVNHTSWVTNTEGDIDPFICSSWSLPLCRAEQPSAAAACLSIRGDEKRALHASAVYSLLENRPLEPIENAHSYRFSNRYRKPRPMASP